MVPVGFFWYILARGGKQGCSKIHTENCRDREQMVTPLVQCRFVNSALTAQPLPSPNGIKKWITIVPHVISTSSSRSRGTDAMQGEIGLVASSKRESSALSRPAASCKRASTSTKKFRRCGCAVQRLPYIVYTRRRSFQQTINLTYDHNVRAAARCFCSKRENRNS